MKELYYYISEMQKPENRLLMLIKPVNQLYQEYAELYKYNEPYLKNRQEYIHYMCEEFNLTTAYHYKTLYFEIF